MKATTLNLLILDDHTLIAGPLTKYLDNRFGARISISSFFDQEKCMASIQAGSHVIILDYLLNGQDKGLRNGLKFFNAIKKRNPKTEVTMITSDEEVTFATKEMQRGTSAYIMNRQRYLDKALRLLGKTIVSPIRNLVIIPFTSFVTFPVRKMIYYYDLKDRVMMFIVAFVSVGVAVLAGMFIVEFFSL